MERFIYTNRASNIIYILRMGQIPNITLSAQFKAFKPFSK